MKTAPIVPARVDFSDAAAPRAPEFGDDYHGRSGAFAQARHVFLAGNGLPGRWAGRQRFVVLETGFGLGNNFLATWAAWRDDPARCERLVFLSIEKHPLTRADLARAHASSPEPALARQLVDAWPPLVPSLQTLDFDDGRVRLMLAFGDAHDWLPELVASVDAFYLDGFAPAKNPELWDDAVFRQVGRLAAPGATAATWSVARAVRDGLAAAGFHASKRPGEAGKWQVLSAVFAPRHRVALPPGRAAVAPDARDVLIVGAGLAGAACARALTRQGLRCQVIEAGATPAAQASGNPGGLFHGTLHGDDGPHARFNRAAALATERELRRIAPALPWLQWGLLRVEREPAALDAMRALLARCGLPADYVQALDADAASTLAGVALAQPAWFFPGGGAVSPPALVDAWLAEAARTEGFELRLGTPVARLERDDESGRWSAYGGAGQLIASADAVVLCGGIGSDPIAAKWSAGPAWPWVSQRGQLSVMAPEGAVDASASTPMSTTMATATARATATPPPNSNSNSNSNSNTMAMATPRLSMPVAGLGYALSLPDGTLCFGASADAGDVDPVLRASDQAQNLGRLKQLLPACPLPDELPLAGRVGWRSLVPDRLPVVGALPAAMPAQRAEQARFWPRQPGLMVLGALASRGLTWATLCAELVAAQLTGAPWPIEASLAEALDPARFGAKRQRAGSSSV